MISLLEDKNGPASLLHPAEKNDRVGARPATYIRRMTINGIVVYVA
jgi:hypothetical protein